MVLALLAAAPGIMEELATCWAHPQKTRGLSEWAAEAISYSDWQSLGSRASHCWRKTYTPGGPADPNVLRHDRLRHCLLKEAERSKAATNKLGEQGVRAACQSEPSSRGFL